MVGFAQRKEATLISKKDDQLECDMGLFDELCCYLVVGSVHWCLFSRLLLAFDSKLRSFPMLLMCVSGLSYNEAPAVQFV
jgi:hypothetical protein